MPGISTSGRNAWQIHFHFQQKRTLENTGDEDHNFTPYFPFDCSSSYWLTLLISA